MKIFSGTAHMEFAKNVVASMNTPLGKSNVSRFSDGEVQVEIQESVRGCDVYLIQSTCPPVNENYMELFIMLDAVRRASPRSITAILPYYGYARQDRKVASRSPISAKCIAEFLDASAIDRVLTIDLHSSQIQGFFNCPVDHLYAVPSFAEHWSKTHGQGSEFVVISPDAGGLERATAFSKRIKSSIAIIDKRRSKPNEAKALQVIGDVEGKTAIIVDDIVDTAGTLTEAAKCLMDNKAKAVYCFSTHAVFSGNAVAKIQESDIKEIWVSDTIPLSKAAQECKKIKVISLAALFGKAIQRIDRKESITSLFD